MKIHMKHYQWIRIVVVMILSFVISISLQQGNYIMAIIAVTVATATLFVLRKHVVGILSDERDMAIGGRSALLTIQIFSMLACMGMFVLFAYKDVNPSYEAIAHTLWVGACLLLLLYAFVFRFFARIENTDRRMIFTLIVLIVFAIIGVRSLSWEDGWTCGKNGWEKHGNPSYGSPASLCQGGNISR